MEANDKMSWNHFRDTKFFFFLFLFHWSNFRSNIFAHSYNENLMHILWLIILIIIIVIFYNVCLCEKLWERKIRRKKNGKFIVKYGLFDKQGAKTYLFWFVRCQRLHKKKQEKFLVRRKYMYISITRKN